MLIVQLFMASELQYLVENLMLDVLLANLMTSNSARITEISLGIIGNLACHESLLKKIISRKDLMEIVVDQSLSEDMLCLFEIYRLLTVDLQSSERITWAKALQSDHVLARILWIAENTLNPLLIEKVFMSSPRGSSSCIGENFERFVARLPYRSVPCGKYEGDCKTRGKRREKETGSRGHFFREEDDKFIEHVWATVEEEEHQARAAADRDTAKDGIATAQESRKAMLNTSLDPKDQVGEA